MSARAYFDHGKALRGWASRSRVRCRCPVTPASMARQLSHQCGASLALWMTSGSAEPSPADYCHCDCERVLVIAGGAPSTSYGDARFAGVVSTAGS